MAAEALSCTWYLSREVNHQLSHGSDYIICFCSFKKVLRILLRGPHISEQINHCLWLSLCEFTLEILGEIIACRIKFIQTIKGCITHIHQGSM